MKKNHELQARLLKPTLAIAKFFKGSGPANAILKVVAEMLRKWARAGAPDLPEHALWPALADESRVSADDMNEYLLERARASARDAAPATQINLEDETLFPADGGAAALRVSVLPWLSTYVLCSC